MSFIINDQLVVTADKQVAPRTLQERPRRIHPMKPETFGKMVRTNELEWNSCEDGKCSFCKATSQAYDVIYLTSFVVAVGKTIDANPYLLWVDEEAMNALIARSYIHVKYN